MCSIKRMQLDRVLVSNCLQTCCGALEYYRRRDLRESWGGPFNGQQGRLTIYRSIVARLQPKFILETGTFRGTTTEILSSGGCPVVTVEANPRYYGFACARFWSRSNVQVLLGDSRRQMERILASSGLAGKPTFVYLDAHWHDDLPLSEELEILFSRFPQAIAMVDDFQVPDDEGYGFDDYGPGKALSLKYIEDAIEGFGLSALWPTCPSYEETGARRGCVVLAGEKWSQALLGLGTLRRSSVAEACPAQS